MAIEIDNKKMWESIIKELRIFPLHHWLNSIIEIALKDQGLCYKDGEITTIEPEVKWYVAMDDYGIYEKTMSQVPIFHKGEKTTKEKVYAYFPNMTDEEFYKHFRPAIEEGITRKTPVEVYQASVDSATKEPEQPKDELTDFEKVLAECIHHSQGNVISPEFIALQWSDALMAEARKQIASEIDATQMAIEVRITDFKIPTLGAAYYQGIVNTIKKIKGESV